eukprot:12606946-Alexandrium_andersonii.AAC.1
MSASLVGSEMCIRDRGRIAALAGVGLRIALWTPRLTLAPVLATVTPNSVSYTHLTLPTICSV